jgi:hypothetical protein
MLIPPGPGNPRAFVIFSLPGGRALHGTCKVVDRGRGVYRPGICLDRTFLRQTRVIKEFKLHVSRKQQTAGSNFLVKFSLNVFVSYFLSCVERISMPRHCSFKTTSSFTLYCLQYRKIFLCLQCLPFDV